MAVTKITVPKTPKSAFNKHRVASGLLLAQLEHLETAAGNYSAPKKKAKKPLTEAQVAARIHHLTRILHPHAAHVELPTERMISHAEDAEPVGRGAARTVRKAARQPVARTRGRKPRTRG
jgi:hypothetical protein